MLYKFARGLLRILYSILFPLEVEGRHHIPKEGPVLLCANHISNLDPPAVGIWLDRKISFFAKEELFRFPLLGWIVRQLGAIPVKRGAGDRKALNAALEVLKQGGMVGIFPEGTRSRSGMVEQAKKGAAFFALRSGAVVIPTAIIGPYRLFRKTKIVYGPPVDLTPYRGVKSSSAVLEEVSGLIMERIRRMVNDGIEP